MAKVQFFLKSNPSRVIEEREFGSLSDLAAFWQRMPDRAHYGYTVLKAEPKYGDVSIQKIDEFNYIMRNDVCELTVRFDADRKYYHNSAMRIGNRPRFASKTINPETKSLVEGRSISECLEGLKQWVRYLTKVTLQREEANAQKREARK